MAEAKHTKRKARAYAEQNGVSYSAARRALANPAVKPGAVDGPPLVDVPCDLVDVFCDGTAHPGRACWWWEPDSMQAERDFAGVSRQVRKSADLPLGRAHELYHRFPRPDNGLLPDPAWFLALVYAMLLSERPELFGGWLALRQAVLADDLDAVDALCEPLDLAAAALLNCESYVWHSTIRPQIEAFADQVCPAGEHPGGMRLTPQGWTTDEPTPWFRGRSLSVWENSAVDLVRKHWRRAFEVYGHDGDGFPMRSHVEWTAPVRALHALRGRRAGAYAAGARVRLSDGNLARITRAHWPDGPGPVLSYGAKIESGRTNERGQTVYQAGVVTMMPQRIVGTVAEDVPTRRPQPAVRRGRDDDGYDAEWDDHRGGCDDCSCCTAERCHSGPDSGCPTDSLGDSICPCTER